MYSSITNKMVVKNTALHEYINSSNHLRESDQGQTLSSSMTWGTSLRCIQTIASALTAACPISAVRRGCTTALMKVQPRYPNCRIVSPQQGARNPTLQARVAPRHHLAQRPTTTHQGLRVRMVLDHRRVTVNLDILKTQVPTHLRVRDHLTRHLVRPIHNTNLLSHTPSKDTRSSHILSNPLASILLRLGQCMALDHRRPFTRNREHHTLAEVLLDHRQ